ncbi:TolC family protein, partial [Desulfovibrio piger]
MKRLAILVAALVCLWPGSPHAASFSLEQAVSRALDVNPTIQSKLLVLEQARMNVGVAQSYFWPRVSLVGSHSVLKNKKEVQTYSSDDMSSKTWTQGWRLTLSLFAGFAHLNNVQKSLLQVDVEDARHRQAR